MFELVGLPIYWLMQGTFSKVEIATGYISKNTGIYFYFLSGVKVI